MSQLDLACAEGDEYQVIDLLDSWGYSRDELSIAMFIAVRHGHVCLLDYLFLDRADVNARLAANAQLTDETVNVTTMLQVAKNKQTCRWLLDMGSMYMCRGEDLMSEAFDNGHINVVHCLFDDELEEGNCDTVDSILAKGYVPEPDSILIPCKEGNITLVTTLLKYKMNCQEGIAIAVKNNHFHLLDSLFLGGVDINLSYRHGKKLLHLTKDPQIYQWLLDMGAAILPDDDGNLPVQLTKLT